MVAKLFVRQEIISAADLTPSDLRCLNCNGNTLILHGQSTIPTYEVWDNGERTKQVSEPITEGAFDVTRMDCLVCERTYLIRDPKMFQLEKENLQLKDENHDLRVEISDRGGPSGTPIPGVGWRN